MHKHIFAYVGSRRKNSQTLKETQRIIDAVNTLYSKSFTYEIVTPLDMKIAASTGCRTCFVNGYCPIEEKGIDDSKILKRKLLDADIIILSSPVYEHNVSSDMKAVIDRLSYWGHLFRLAGKSGVVLARGDSNGIGLVSSYLEKIATVFGLNVIDSIESSSFYSPDDKYLSNLSEEIYSYAFNLKRIETDSRAEMAFGKYKKLYKKRPLTLAEPRYWKENGMFDHDSLQSYIDEIVALQKDIETG